MSETDPKADRPARPRRTPGEWAIYSLYLPPLLFVAIFLYYFVKGLFGL